MLKKGVKVRHKNDKKVTGTTVTGVMKVGDIDMVKVQWDGRIEYSSFVRPNALVEVKNRGKRDR